MSDVSTPVDVRDEDAFDVEPMAIWLRANASDAGGLHETPTVRQFSGGASNLTYLLQYPGGRELILRRPPGGTKARGAHDMGREHNIQAALRPAFPKVAPMVAYCDDESVIGSEFYVMERIPGTILRREIPADLRLDADAVDRLCRNAIDTLVELHRVDPGAVGLAGLGKGEGYVARQVGGWSARYRAARTPDVGDFEATMAWLDGHQPDDIAQVLIHNDFRFDNLVLSPEDPTRVVGVLDWEMATIGDPLMDLASGLAYWAQADDPAPFLAMRRQPTNAPGMWRRAQVVEHYCAAMGFTMDPERWRFYDVFGGFRLAVIAQQIYYRFFHGQTTNPMYGEFVSIVRFLDAKCAELIAAQGDSSFLGADADADESSSVGAQATDENGANAEADATGEGGTEA